MKIMIGADPELFVKKNGVFESAHGLIPGNKEYPTPVPNGAVQVDGMALEFNIHPADDESKFVYNISDVMNTLMSMVPDYEVVATPVAHFTKEYIDSQPEEAKMLGCSADFNAWTGCINPKPNQERPMRTAAGHIHIGWGDGFDIRNPEHIENCEGVVKQLDYYLGLPSLLYDDNTDRRSMYGAAGCYRPKPYGVEYRVLSNKWLASVDLMKWVFNNTMIGVKKFFNGEMLTKDIQKIINKSDVKAAKRIIMKNHIEVPYGYVL